MKQSTSLNRHALQEAVVSHYRITGSLELTADHLSISTYKVRKILITAGEWSSPFSEQVEKMKNSSLSISDIAKQLSVSTNVSV